MEKGLLGGPFLSLRFRDTVAIGSEQTESVRLRGKSDLSVIGFSWVDIGGGMVGTPMLDMAHSGCKGSAWTGQWVSPTHLTRQR